MIRLSEYLETQTRNYTIIKHFPFILSAEVRWELMSFNKHSHSRDYLGINFIFLSTIQFTSLLEEEIVMNTSRAGMVRLSSFFTNHFLGCNARRWHNFPLDLIAPSNGPPRYMQNFPEPFSAASY